MMDSTLGAKGRAAGGVYQFGIARAETIKDGGMEVPVAMGSAEAINFQPTGSGKAAITGDFVLTAAEVNPVLRALRQNGIEVTALHAPLLHAFLGERRCAEARQRPARGPRQDQYRPQLTMRWLVVLLIALFCMTGTGLVAEPPAPLVLERTIALKASWCGAVARWDSRSRR